MAKKPFSVRLEDEKQDQIRALSIILERDLSELMSYMIL